ncbi:MAG: archaemetzincin [Verrucomicrobiales bacterium]|nr:archaemetzincin [Verrucomicrobiales bacterium]
MRSVRLLFFGFLLICIFGLLAVRGTFLAKGNEKSFQAPETTNRIAAIGSLRYLPAEEQKAFSAGSAFVPKRPPEPSDWLAQHREPGQTFDQFLRTRRNLFQPPRVTLYVQPIGAFENEAAKVLEEVASYAQIFFDAEVRLQNPVAAETLELTTRKNPFGGQEQFLSTDVLDWLEKDLPADAYARIAVTMTDLYPDPTWNFVFGQASLQERVGVYSFHRYGKAGTPQFLRRCLRVFSHETGHMFTFYHCIHFECLMNGSNHLEESDRTPLFLCPVCLRKLHAANAFTIRNRYQEMGRFFQGAGLEAEAIWIDRRLSEIGE